MSRHVKGRGLEFRRGDGDVPYHPVGMFDRMLSFSIVTSSLRLRQYRGALPNWAAR
jgi:hypothetical protein